MPSPQGYQLKETLFTSSQTEVFRARRYSDGQSVIIRTLPDNALGDESNKASDNETEAFATHTSDYYSRLAFTREVLEMLDHPSIVKVVDWVDDQRNPSLIMEDIQGIDLWAYAETFDNKQIPLEAFLKLAIQLADALSVIHHAQVIHKDLHPGNMVINPSVGEKNSGRVQIIDFGLASLLSREQPALATPDKLEGILAYISPEQTGRMNRALDYRSDFYTLGITFYQLLSGKQPFEADDALGMVYAHMATVQQPVKTLRADIPESLSKLVDKLMHKNAEGRYQSALGLKHDLEHCLDDLNKGIDSNFSLGEQDISSYFTIPQVLYGREQQVQDLMQRFYFASAGQPQLLCVAGYSGIGKSALVHEVHKPIAAHKGLFMQGKFDQFQKNVPFSALKRALASWLQMALSLGQSEFTALGEELNQYLGTNARVLIDFMDDFKRLLGDLPPVPELGAQESKNRFYLLMQRFIKRISLHQPLVLFIDDLQWADRGTLNLLPELLSKAGCRLLVIVAYRDNEVDRSHPALQMIEKVRSFHAEPDQESDQKNIQQLVVSQLTLGPLPLTQIQHLLVDALHHNESGVRPLAELVLQKTGGNPFFTIEFLKKLYADSLLDFDLQAQQWTWSLKAIKAKDITDNVVELMLGKMHTLPADTQNILQLAACVGTYFDIETLAMLAEKDMSEVAHALWPALQAGLLIQEGGDWFLGMLGQRNLLSASVSAPSQLPANDQEHAESTASDQPDEPYVQQNERRKSPWVPRCKFLHDRMLQAAYESLNEQERQQAHLRIGRMLLQHYPEAERSQELFAIIGQLNLGLALINDNGEKYQLAQLNLHAAKQAKHASVWDAALRYAYIGIELLNNNAEECHSAWKTDYALNFELHLMQAECEFLISNHEQGQILAEALLEKAETTLEKAQICFLLASQQMTLGLDYCINQGLAGLGFCGFHPPQDTTHRCELSSAGIPKFTGFTGAEIRTNASTSQFG